mmetsp:Transcript_29469/g.76072  ORF Transcript_29469/g.76072 Transcript_29469/m.76072 type:complete len:106 (-) Transcript_29469:1257-1574(-)
MKWRERGREKEKEGVVPAPSLLHPPSPCLPPLPRLEVKACMHARKEGKGEEGRGKVEGTRWTNTVASDCAGIRVCASVYVNGERWGHGDVGYYIVAMQREEGMQT